jgi:flagellar basal-body rod protein FlgC
MTLSAVLSTALSGMQGQVTRISATASNVANSQSIGYDRLSAQFQSVEMPGVSAVQTGGQTVDPLRDMTELIEAELAYKANASVFETGADMWEVLASIKRD